MNNNYLKKKNIIIKGNVVPNSYEEYQRLMEKGKYSREQMMNEPEYIREREITKNEELYNSQMEYFK